MSIVFDGLAFGMLLFLISVGLSVTLGLMHFVNLAHGVFAMVGGYVCARLLGDAGMPFMLTLPCAMLASAAAGVLAERLLYRRLYGAPAIDQVLFSLGLVFMATAATRYFFGARQQPLRLPDFLSGQVQLAGVDVGIYRLFLVLAGVLVLLALQWGVVRTRLGAQLRAAVDSQRTARCMGIAVDRVFLFTFALGSALAGLGGALGVEMLGMDPQFPVKYLVYFLIVVVVGGSGSIGGSFLAALLLGVLDAAGKYYLPQLGVFIIYALMLVILVLRPQGLLGARGPAAQG